MKKYLILFILLFSNFSFAQSYADEKTYAFFIEFRSCFTNLIPNVLYPIQGQDTAHKILRCTKSDNFYFCNLQTFSLMNENRDILLFEKTPQSPTATMQFGSGDNSENIVITNRVATYTKVSHREHYSETNICQGVFTTEETLKKIQPVILNFGFSKIKL